MIKSFSFALASLLLTTAALATAPIDPEDYPRLSHRQMMVVRDLVERARQPLEEWPRAQFGYGPTAGSTNPADSDLIYQVRADAAALAQVQYDKVPAYRELYQYSLDALLQKMLDPRIWGSWYELSRWEDGILFDKGGGQLNPWADPFKKHNIMYSGNLFQMLGYYAMLYRDPRYDAAGSLSYAWDTSVAASVGARYNGPRQIFRYSYPELAQALHRQYVKGHYIGIACQPKYAFTLCNEVPILGYRHYDLTHGTTYAPETEQHYLATLQWDERTQRFQIFVNQETGEPHYVQPEQQLGGDPIGGMFWHHPINPERVKRAYPYHRDIALQFYVGNVPEAVMDQGIGFGFFANYAAEVGDLDTRDKLIAYADKHFTPQTGDGRFRYAITDIPVPASDRQHFEVWQGNDRRQGVRNVFGGQANSLMAMAQLNDGGAQWRMYNRPWTREHFKQPYIGGVDYPRVLVNQAIYDPLRKALMVGLEAGDKTTAGQVSFEVHQLAPDKDYRVAVDGKTLGHLIAGKVDTDALLWSTDHVLTVKLSLATPRAIVIHETGSR